MGGGKGMWRWGSGLGWLKWTGMGVMVGWVCWGGSDGWVGVLGWE